MSALLKKIWPVLLPLLVSVQVLYWLLLPLLAGASIYFAAKSDRAGTETPDSASCSSSRELAAAIEEYLLELGSCSCLLYTSPSPRDSA